jgi:hypothetical protein
VLSRSRVDSPMCENPLCDMVILSFQRDVRPPPSIPGQPPQVQHVAVVYLEVIHGVKLLPTSRPVAYTSAGAEAQNARHGAVERTVGKGSNYGA